ncbi:APC family permease [Oceanirhabdus seepicola]|uniref:Amino acid permease n=1 Tax=Oceanirhabdus seepicola TaxID=2828781 RepID=A0A9J6PA49_9CLOT|nr:APC family permease [Oceanirhabdus seepicola]MCM1992269.1 amino acid permease [Oceanirhabdus seepicola]
MENKNKLGLFSIVLLGINSIIGSGIFGLPGKAYKLMGPASMLVIIFCMLLSVSIALCFAEAGSWFKVNGGPYIYAKEAFGDFIGFEVGFMKWAICIIAWSAMANFFASTLATVFPAVGHNPGRLIVTAAMLIGLAVMNLMGVKASKIVNNVVTIGKLVPLLLFVMVGIFFIKGANFTPFTIIPEGQTFTQSFFAASLIIFYAYTGFESLAVAAEEMESPEKNIPKALVLVMLFVSIIYVLVMAISTGVLGGALAGSDAPVADAAQVMFGGAGKAFIVAGTIISVGGINMASSFHTPRAAVALAEQGLLPAFVAKKNKHGAPAVAIIVSVALSLLLAVTGSFSFLLQISVISRFLQYIPTCIAVLVFRKKYADRESSFRIPFGPVVPILATAVSVWLLYHAALEDPTKILIGFGGLVIGIPMYFIMKSINGKAMDIEA